MKKTGCLFLEKRLSNTHFQTAKFGKASQTSDARITGVCFFLQVIYHLMAMVGAHRNRTTAPLLQFKQGFHYTIHIDISFQMVCFVEIAFSIPLCTAEMNEVDAVAIAFHNAGEVIVAAYTKRTGAQT